MSSSSETEEYFNLRRAARFLPGVRFTPENLVKLYGLETAPMEGPIALTWAALICEPFYVRGLRKALHAGEGWPENSLPDCGIACRYMSNDRADPLCGVKVLKLGRDHQIWGREDRGNPAMVFISKTCEESLPFLQLFKTAPVDWWPHITPDGCDVIVSSAPKSGAAVMGWREGAI